MPIYILYINILTAWWPACLSLSPLIPVVWDPPWLLSLGEGGIDINLPLYNRGRRNPAFSTAPLYTQQLQITRHVLPLLPQSSHDKWITDIAGLLYQCILQIKLFVNWSTFYLSLFCSSEMKFRISTCWEKLMLKTYVQFCINHHQRTYIQYMITHAAWNVDLVQWKCTQTHCTTHTVHNMMFVIIF